MQVIAQCEIEPRECRAMASELHVCTLALGSSATDTSHHVLRFRTTVHSATRLARLFSDAIVSVYTRQTSTLALPLGVDDQRAVLVLPESEVRANLTFQASLISTE